MNLPNRSWILSLPALCGAAFFSAAACGPPPSPPPPDGSPTANPTETPTADPTSIGSGTPTPDPSATASATFNGCRLAAARKSGDACKVDADCGVSQPCHARECVAKARAHPPDKDTICTRMMDCESADANPCACFEGVCALVPPVK